MGRKWQAAIDRQNAEDAKIIGQEKGSMRAWMALERIHARNNVSFEVVMGTDALLATQVIEKCESNT